ncbi:MAG TPA: chlorite dismutase family protein [Chloroflexota bacterium]|nr:chlorite dismutase family protein [Chloroflexota bacterium]
MNTGDPIYALFWLYRVAPEWRRLPEAERAGQRAQFADTLQAGLGPLTLRGAYSLAGLRHDADLLLWLHGPDLVAAQRLAVALRKTGLGAYLENVYTYSGVAPESRYAPEHRPAFVKGVEPRAFLSMYPFTKTHEWYLLPFEQRRALMAEHGRMGQPHSALPEVRIETGGDARGGSATAVVEAPVAAPSGKVLTNTVHSFGLGDHEFVVAFESDDPVALERMVEDLRGAEVRRYTANDTPIFLGYRKEVPEALADLG